MSRSPHFGGARPPFRPGLPLGATLKIGHDVENMVRWKMTYMYDGFRIVAQDPRGLDRHVAATGLFDETVSGYWN